MPKIGCLGKIVIAFIVVLVLVVVGGMLLGLPRPEVHLPPNDVFHIGSFAITNTMLASWLTMLVLTGLLYFGTRRMKLVPSGLQNFLEAILEWLLNFVEGAAGRVNGRRFFYLVAAIFLFVITNAYLSLLPGFNFIGYGEQGTYETAFFGEQSSFVVHSSLLRLANTDINLPLALAIFSFVFVEFWGIRALGFRHYMGKFIKLGSLVNAFKSLLRGRIIDFITGVVEAFIGIIEGITELVRLVSFTFRLFGNMTAGEVLLLMMAFLLPLVAAMPFYGLELLIGFIQALIFAGLTLGFAMIATIPHEPEHA
ncbi:F0F1 ATP synthase subunit A [Chloroflexota bacterium]